MEIYVVSIVHKDSRFTKDAALDKAFLSKEDAKAYAKAMNFRELSWGRTRGVGPERKYKVITVPVEE